MADLYLVLGVRRDASMDEIAEANRRIQGPMPGWEGVLLRLAVRRRRQARRAYRILSDAAQRERYDRVLAARER